MFGLETLLAMIYNAEQLRMLTTAFEDALPKV